MASETGTGESEIPAESQAPAQTQINMGIPVLMYHHLLPESMMADLPYNASIISFESFYGQMKWLKSQGWQTLTLDQLHAALESDMPLPDKSFVVTFDDGYASNLYFAFPVLNRLNYTGVEFIITANLEEEIQKWDGKKLSWLNVQAISRVFSIQSHSHAFHQMEEGQALLSIRTEEEIREDLAFAWAEIDRHIEPGIRAFAYPYGVTSPAAVKVLKEQGVSLAFTTQTGYLTKETDPLLIPRFGITPSVTMEDFQQIFGVKPPEEESNQDKSSDETIDETIHE
jgi:peptidoglycan/xylan/chitin deacetylase (PgdA/CDA1 family)